MLFFFAFFSFLCNGREFLSYIDINFLQTATVYDSSIFSGGMVNGSLSFSYDVNQNVSTYLSYILNYDGVGFWGIEKDIKERGVKQSLVFETHYLKNDSLRIRPQLFLGVQKFRDSAVSSYKDSIYNNRIKGVGVSLDFIRKDPITIYLNYRRINYPNYTDLLSEISYGLHYTKGGVYDKDVYEAGIRLKKYNWFFDFSYTFFDYLNQKVIKENATYSKVSQKDKNTSFTIGFKKVLYGEFLSYPSFKLDIYLSNQNYLRYKTFFDTSPYFVKDAFSYIDYSFDFPFNMKLMGYLVNFDVNFTRRNYLSRPPLNSNNEYKSGRQNVNIFKFSSELTKDITDLSFYRVGYVFSKSSSNNKFERYIPYNYTNHTFYLGYGVRY